MVTTYYMADGMRSCDSLLRDQTFWTPNISDGIL